MSEANPPAVTIGGESIAVPIVRALARAGVPSHAVGGSPAYNPIRYSRYCSGYADVGSKHGVQERTLDWLLTRGPSRAVLLPCNDDALEMILRNRTLLEDRGYVPPEFDEGALRTMLDKERTYELAYRIGIPAPRTARPRNEEDATAIARQIDYPCALKPLHSALFARHFGVGNKLLVANGPDELRDGLARMGALGLEMLVTEIVPGPDDLLLSHCGYLDEQGEPLTQFTFRKVRQFPPHFGLGCYVISDWNDEVIEAGLRFLRGAGLKGLFHVEFKRDPRDGQLKILECNHRFTIEAMFSPIDLPLLTYNRLLGRRLPKPTPYRPGTRLWSPVDDLRAARSMRRRNELTWPAWTRSVLRRQRFQVFRSDDPLPTVAYHWKWAGRVIRRSLSRAGARQAPRLSDPLLPR